MIITDIREVSLYRNGAYITRYGNIPLKKGKQCVAIEGLTPTLDPSTLTVALSGKVSGSNIRVNVPDLETRNELKKDLLRQIEETEQKIAVRNSQIEILNLNTDFTKKENISLSEMEHYIDALPEKIEKIRKEITGLNDQLTALRKQLKEKEKKDSSYIAMIDMECEEDGDYPIRLRYYERNASWDPFYEIHTKEDETLSLRLKAKIRQGTIEDWKGISFRLFSGDPSVSADLPVLYPNHLGFHAPRLYKNSLVSGGRAMAFSAAKGMAMEDTADCEAEEAFEEVRFDAARKVENDTMSEYDLEGKYDIDHINEIDVDLSSRDIACRYHTIAIPKADSFGYLAAEVRTSEIEEVLDTQAAVYHLENYLGNIYLSFDPSEETYDISLGKDESIRLKRTQKKKYRSNVLLKGQTKVEFVYELEVSSLKQKEAKVTLKDQLPVSDDKTIVVEKQELSGGTLKEDTGEVNWDFDLGAGEKKTFTLSYSVSWPKDKSLDI